MNLDAILKITAKVFGQDSLDKLHGSLGKMTTSADAAKRSFKDVVNNSAFQAAAVAAAGIGVALGTSVAAAVRFESAMADVRKVVPGLDDAAGLREMEQAILDLSREIPISAEGFAQIIAAAGQAGIAKDELVDFARAAAQMSVAFDISADQAGEAMAKLRTSMGLNQPEVVDLADAMNYLSNNMASSAPEITDFMLRVGALGQQVAMSEEQTAALGSAMIAAGAPAEVAATSFRNLIKALTIGDAATKRQEDAFEALGLTASDVAKRMQEDAVGTMRDVFQRLAALPAEMRIPTMSQLFGDEARALTPLLTNLDLFENAMQLVGDKTNYAGSMLGEFETRSKTTANQMQLFKSNMEALQIVVGQALLPALNSLAAILLPVLKVVADAAQRFPLLTTAVVGLAAALSALVLALPFVASLLSIISSLGGAGAIIAAVGGAIAGFGATIAGWAGIVVPVFGGIVAAVKTLGAILLGVFSGPVGWAALLIAAVAALYVFREPVTAFFSWLGGALQGWIASLWQWGEPVRNFWIGLWEAVKGVTLAFVGWLGTAFMGILAPITAALAPMVALFQGAWDAVRDVVVGFSRWYLTAIQTMVIDPVRNALPGIVQFFQSAWDAVRGFMTGWFSWWGGVLYQVLIEPVQAALSGLAGIFQRAFTAAANAVGNAWGTLTAGFQRYVVTPIQGLWAGLTGSLVATVQAIAATVQGAWLALSAGFDATVVQPIRTAWQALQGWMADMVQGAASTVAKAYESIAGGIVGAFRGIVQGITSVINGVIGLINKLIAGVNKIRTPVGLSAIAAIPQVRVPAFAEGGYVTRPTLGYVGEGGESEFIIPQSKMARASANYLAGVRGAAVLSAAPTMAAPSSATSGGVQVNITTGPVIEQGGERYVTVGDMERAVRQTAAQVYATLRTPSGRRAIGVA